MIPNIFATLFYIVGFIVLLGGTILIKKTSNKLNILLWAVVDLMAICCFQTFVAAIYALITIPVNIITLACANIVAGGLLLLHIHKLKEVQAYFVEKWNIVGMQRRLQTAPCWRRLTTADRQSSCGRLMP